MKRQDPCDKFDRLRVEGRCDNQIERLDALIKCCENFIKNFDQTQDNDKIKKILERIKRGLILLDNWEDSHKFKEYNKKIIDSQLIHTILKRCRGENNKVIIKEIEELLDINERNEDLEDTIFHFVQLTNNNYILILKPKNPTFKIKSIGSFNFQKNGTTITEILNAGTNRFYFESDKDDKDTTNHIGEKKPINLKGITISERNQSDSDEEIKSFKLDSYELNRGLEGNKHTISISNDEISVNEIKRIIAGVNRDSKNIFHYKHDNNYKIELTEEKKKSVIEFYKLKHKELTEDESLALNIPKIFSKICHRDFRNNDGLRICNRDAVEIFKKIDDIVDDNNILINAESPLYKYIKILHNGNTLSCETDFERNIIHIEGLNCLYELLDEETRNTLKKIIIDNLKNKKPCLLEVNKGDDMFDYLQDTWDNESKKIKLEWSENGNKQSPITYIDQDQDKVLIYKISDDDSDDPFFIFNHGKYNSLKEEGLLKETMNIFDNVMENKFPIIMFHWAEKGTKKYPMLNLDHEIDITEEQKEKCKNVKNMLKQSDLNQILSDILVKLVKLVRGNNQDENTENRYTQDTQPEKVPDLNVERLYSNIDKLQHPIPKNKIIPPFTYLLLPSLISLGLVMFSDYIPLSIPDHPQTLFTITFILVILIQSIFVYSLQYYGIINTNILPFDKSSQNFWFWRILGFSILLIISTFDTIFMSMTHADYAFVIGVTMLLITTSFLPHALKNLTPRGKQVPIDTIKNFFWSLFSFILLLSLYSNLGNYGNTIYLHIYVYIPLIFLLALFYCMSKSEFKILSINTENINVQPRGEEGVIQEEHTSADNELPEISASEIENEWINNQNSEIFVKIETLDDWKNILNLYDAKNENWNWITFKIKNPERDIPKKLVLRYLVKYLFEDEKQEHNREKFLKLMKSSIDKFYLNSSHLSNLNNFYKLGAIHFLCAIMKHGKAKAQIVKHYEEIKVEYNLPELTRKGYATYEIKEDTESEQ